MNIKPVLSSLLAIMALSVGQAALSATVYQWTDEEGVVHFSDVPPNDTAITEHQQIELQEYAQASADPDQYSIVNQLETMAAWRRQISEERLAQKQLQLEARRIANERNTNRYNIIERGIYQQPEYYPYPVYISRFRRGHGLHVPSHHQGPVHRPVHRSGYSGHFGGGAFKLQSRGVFSRTTF